MSALCHVSLSPTHSLALDAHFLLRDEMLNDDICHLVPVCVALVVQACEQ